MIKKESDKTAKRLKELETQVKDLSKLNADMTELKNIEKFAVIGRLTRTLAHDIRNPLTNINLAVDQLKNDMKDKDSELMLDMISRNSEKINNILGNILTSVKAPELVFDKKNINELLSESIALAQSKTDSKGLKVIKDYESDLCTVTVDAQRIKNAFINIIENAIESMNSGKGLLTVRTRTENDKCTVTIQDNGKGIETMNLSRIFEPYYTTKQNGSGLGLTTAQNIILSHKASIRVQSELGKGTTFIISFTLH
jgi:signal transduction histidine kinase